MNSLTYISRHFDGLASSRTPPNTPTIDVTPHPPVQPPSSAAGSSMAHRAVERTAWSLRSLVAPSPPPRRSLSSPARMPILRRRPSIRSAIWAKSQSASQSVLRRLFFVRILELVWHALCTAAASLRVDDVWHGRRLSPRGLRPRRKSAVIREEPSAEEQEGIAMPAHQLGAEQALPHTESVVKSPVTANGPPLAVNPLPVARTSTEPPTPDANPSARLSLAYAQPQLFAALMPTPPPSRTPTPTYAPSAGLPITPRKAPSHKQPKTLVLDLDETLIHSTSRPLPAAGIRGLFGTRRAASHTVEVVMGGRSTLYHVYKRPFVDFFLRKVSAWYTLVIFTASMQEYADPVIDWLDAGQGILRRRFFRESCTQLPNGSYTKNLALVEQDLSRICLVDNSPICYSVNEMNGIPIEGWTHDPSDEALLDLLPVLDSLRFTNDVRRVLGIRGYS